LGGSWWILVDVGGSWVDLGWILGAVSFFHVLDLNTPKLPPQLLRTAQHPHPIPPHTLKL
jgi:hypothetical protein